MTDQQTINPDVIADNIIAMLHSACTDHALIGFEVFHRPDYHIESDISRAIEKALYKRGWGAWELSDSYEIGHLQGADPESVAMLQKKFCPENSD